ncbi:MAG: hypothetical protein V8Q09_02515 [Adlercreutzia sp.]
MAEYIVRTRSQHSSEWSSKTRNDITEDAFDVIITNPPFGKKLAIDSEAILKRYDLGHRWKQAKGIQHLRKVSFFFSAASDSIH